MLEDGSEEAGGAGPPGAVDAGGEDMVGAVVGGGDGVEHLLDVRCGGLLGGDAGGAGSGGEFVFGSGFAMPPNVIFLRSDRLSVFPARIGIRPAAR